MFTDHHNRIRQRFIIAIGFALIVMAVLFWLDSEHEYRLVVSAAENRSVSAARILKEHVESVFTEADNSLLDILNDLYEHRTFEANSVGYLYEELALHTRNSPQFNNLFMTNRAGTLLASAGSGSLGNKTDYSVYDFFKHHKTLPRDDSPYISDSFKSPATGKWQFTISRPVLNEAGEFDGVVAASFSIDYFVNFYFSMDLGKKSRVLLVRNDGQLLLAAPFDESIFEKDFRKSILIRDQLPHAAHGTYRMDAGSALLGESGNRIVSYVTLGRFPVIAVANIDQDMDLKAWKTAVAKHGIIAGFLALLTVVLSVHFLRQLKNISNTSQDMSRQQQELQIKAEMIDAVRDPILLVDEKGRLVQFSNALCDLTGCSRQELETCRIQELMPAENGELVEGRIRHVLEKGEAVFEAVYLHVSGKRIPVEGLARPVEIGHRKLVLSVLHDVSERQVLEDKLKAVASEWRDTFDAVEDAVWLLDMDKHVLRANKATQTMFGMQPQDAVGIGCCDIAHKSILHHESCPFENMRNSGKRASMQVPVGMKWFEVSIDPVFDENGKVIRAVHVVKDITALKKAELREQLRSKILEKIARSEALPQLLNFMASSIEQERPGALCSILLVNETGTHLEFAAAPSLPEAYNAAAGHILIAEGIGSCGTAAFRRERVVVEDISVHPFWKGFTPARDAGLRSCWSEPIFSSSGQLLGTFAIYHREPAIPGDDEIKMIELAASYAGIAIERSRIEAERDQLEQQLSQSQKMEAIGHLAGGVAHDFNNLLTPIIIYSDLIKRALPGDEALHAKIDGIIKASGKARELTHQLLSFGRKQVMQMQTVNLNEIITSFSSIMRRTLRESIEIDLQLSSQDKIVFADRSKIEQVLLNLAINAQDAIADTGSITIETGQVLIDDEYARLHPGMKTGDFVLLSFRDTGSGMEDEIMRHVFEPFFTTKQVGHGTGLGLANVYGIVKQHNGYIAVQSCVGKGTVFKIYLPLSSNKLTSDGQLPAGNTAEHVGNEVILLVEDNEMVRIMTSDLLKDLGYRVYTEGHPERALELARLIPEKIDLLITDVVMPGMNGQQLFERLNVERPDIDKVLYMSGYTNNVIVTNGSLEEGVHFLQKPFTVDALMEKINLLLHPSA
ncbi:MAG: PAS domain S-box protein [Geobacter sp.]|nr:PAS domain S-box protein [Geobacter sp.]